MTSESDPNTTNSSGTNNSNNVEFAQIVRKFESSFVRVPFEQFRRAFRMEMKIAEKDLPALEALMKKHLGDNKAESSVSENVLKALRDRIRTLEERMREYRGESVKFRDRFLKRMKWVEEVASNGNYRSWSRGRLIRLIGDFLIRSGEIDLVREMGRKRPELIDEFDLELEEMRRGVSDSLKEKQLTETLQWCADHRGNLKRIGSDLEFKLRRQEFVELLREGDVSGALKASQKHFPGWLETNYKEIREALALICWFPFLQQGLKWDNGLMGKYEELLGVSQWAGLQAQFQSDFVAIYQVDQGSQLIKTVKTGLSALKTRQCCDENDSECPACCGPLRELSRSLPFGHFETTKIRCRITGKLASEDDPPMALPNGQVYSESGLKRLILGNDGSDVLKCPASGQLFHLSEARRCFFL